MAGCLTIFFIALIISLLISNFTKILGAALFVGSLSTIIYYVIHKKEFFKHTNSKKILISLCLVITLVSGTSLSFFSNSNASIEKNTSKLECLSHTENKNNTTTSVSKTDSNKVTDTDPSIASAINLPSKLSVHFIDVGQGDATFIDFGDYDILIDAGDNDTGQKVVNYLKDLNTDDIELMIATHPHADHIGGLDDVLSAFKVEKIIDSGEYSTTNTYTDYIHAITTEKSEGAEFIKDSDMSFDLGNGAIFKVIELGDGYENLNDDSVITVLDYNNVEFLFAGDLESTIERNNLDKFSDIDILKVGHHGSKTSTCNEFLSTITPEVAIVSAGLDNQYGHPHKETLVNLENHNISNIYGTWKSGNIVITTDGEKYDINATESIHSNDISTYPVPTNNVAPTISTSNNAQYNHQTESTYVGSSKSDKFHEPGCRWVKKIKPGNLVEFSSRNQAVNSGYIPCGTCRP